jgi:hypothetical protein
MTIAKNVLTLALIVAAATVCLAAGPSAYGRAARLLQARDVADITRLSGGRGVLAIEIGWDQVLPEAWLASVYMAPDSEANGVRRGRVLDFKTLVEHDRALAWRVMARDGRYAQVALPGHVFSDQIDGTHLDRPFTLFGQFSDAELASVVAFVRSSPKPPTVAQRNGEIVSDGLGLDGQEPVMQLKRVNSTTVEVWMGRESGAGTHAVLHFRNRAWQLGTVSFFVA